MFGTTLNRPRLRIQELGNQKRWIDWIFKHQEDIGSLSDLKMETRKDYLEGILDKITVTLNDDSTHRLTVKFKYPIVGDQHEWNDSTKKSDGYQIHDGSTDIEVSGTLTKRGGAPIKTQSNVSGVDGTLTPTLETPMSRWSRGLASCG